MDRSVAKYFLVILAGICVCLSSAFAQGEQLSDSEVSKPLEYAERIRRIELGLKRLEALNAQVAEYKRRLALSDSDLIKEFGDAGANKTEFFIREQFKALAFDAETRAIMNLLSAE